VGSLYCGPHSSPFADVTPLKKELVMNSNTARALLQLLDRVTFRGDELPALVHIRKELEAEAAKDPPPSEGQKPNVD